MARLLSTPELHRHRLARLVLDSEFHNWGLCRLLLYESRQVVPLSPAYSLELAELSHAIAEVLDPDFYGSELVADFRAEVAAHLAVLYRHHGRADQAGRLSRLARGHLEAGTGRRRISLAVENAESLFSRDNPPGHVPCDPGKDAESPKYPRKTQEFHDPRMSCWSAAVRGIGAFNSPIK